ncbi:MAG TPA: HEAT repeat domain-containing protein [Planctomycetaceae bacterium]|nr:HEAT repeat domain-containing protein [Planctomycetaceae bacterium]
MKSPQILIRSLVVLAASIAVTLPSALAFEGPATSPEKEAEFLAVLRSEAPASEKALACKNLAIYGSNAAVSDLAQLLPDPQLASWARIALEAIPGEAADNALQTAMTSLEGRLLVGTINSIGVRRDAKAAAALATRLQDKDAEVASAAAVALGRIGNADATQSLRSALASAPENVRSAVAEGLILCAERAWTDGKSDDAIAIYDEVRHADVPLQRVVEGTRGAILARGDDGIPLLIEQMQSPNKVMFQLALATAREFPGGKVDAVLAKEMVAAPPERAALIVQAMADRPQTVVLAAVLKAADQGALPVRLSAIDALARVGDVSCLPSLLKSGLESNPDLAAAAKDTLARIPGEPIDAQIIALLPKAEGKMYLLLLQTVGQRRIDAVPELLEAIGHSDKDVRRAALVALGETVRQKRLPVLIALVTASKHPEDVPVATTALKQASIRMPDREACASELSAAVDKSSSVPTKISLLEILGAVGGTKAVNAVGAAGKSKNPQLQDISTRLLGEWMTEDAAPVLLDIARIPDNPYNIRALRGYIRIARQFVLPDDQRAKMCQTAFDAAQQTAEKKLVLDVLKRYPSEETLKQAIKAMKVADLKEDATQATLVIASKLGGKGIDVKTMLTGAGLDTVKLEIIKAEYGAGATQKDVTAILQKQVGDLPLLTLESASYNASFGGDPAPGNVKQLKVQYKLNGKTGEATFAEDALIVFPMPK